MNGSHNNSRPAGVANSLIAFTRGEVADYYNTRVPRLKRRSAKEWRGPCPIHLGKNDNFAVETATGLWFCHSTCGRGGDILRLEQDLSGADFKTAIATVYAIVGRPMPEWARATTAECRARQEVSTRESQELLEARYFAKMQRNLIAEEVLERLPDTSPERVTHTAILAALKVVSRRPSTARGGNIARNWQPHSCGQVARG